MRQGMKKKWEENQRGVNGDRKAGGPIAKEKNQRNEITRGDRQQDIEISEKTMPQSSWTSFVSREWWADRNPRGRAYGIQSIDSFDKRYAKWARKRGRYPLVPTPMHSMVLIWFSYGSRSPFLTSQAVPEPLKPRRRAYVFEWNC